MEPIAVAGGGAQSALWCQIYADVLRRTLRRVADPIQVNTRGAGLLALAALGHVGFDEFEALVPIADTFRPSPEVAAVYDTAYAAFRRIHRANRRLYARLNPAA
jgi:xylulokinase